MLPLVVLLLVAGLGHAHAQPCSVDYAHPVKGAALKASLVQAFLACGGDFGNPPNATTETGTVPSCYPSETFHENAGSPNLGWTWGPKSKGAISFKAGKNQLLPPEHALNTDPEARDVAIRLSLADIRDGTGLVHEKTGFLFILLRTTLIDRANGDLMTTLDFPIGTPFLVINGKATVKTSVTARLNQLDQPALPRCASLEILHVQVTDWEGSAFATMGVFLP